LPSSARSRIVNEKYTGNNRVAAAALYHGTTIATHGRSFVERDRKD